MRSQANYRYPSQPPTMARKDSQDTAPATKADVARIVEQGIGRVLNRFEEQDKRFKHIDDQMKVDYERTSSMMATLGKLEDDVSDIKSVVKTTADDVRIVKAWAKQDKAVLTDHEQRLQVAEQRLGIAS